MAQRQLRDDDTSVFVEKYGDGSDGDVAINNSTDAPIDSACSGSADATALTATNASFATGQLILIHQTRGTGAGNWELNKIASYSAGTITTSYPLINTYANSGASVAQVLVLTQYDEFTINSGQTLTAKAWNGTVGGIVAKIAKTSITVTGNISAVGGTATNGNGATGGGFRGSAGRNSIGQGNQAEGTGGAGSASTNANGNGAGGTNVTSAPAGGGGSGGGNGGAGSLGTSAGNTVAGDVGAVAGNAGLTSMVFGGGGAGNGSSGGLAGGGAGGGIVILIAPTITITGTITTNGGRGLEGTGGDAANDGGSGAGGSILLKGNDLVLGSNLATATGGAAQSNGGAGGTGRIHADYGTSITGTTNPTIDSRTDTSFLLGGGSALRAHPIGT